MSQQKRKLKAKGKEKDAEENGLTFESLGETEQEKEWRKEYVDGLFQKYNWLLGQNINPKWEPKCTPQELGDARKDRIKVLKSIEEYKVLYKQYPHIVEWLDRDASSMNPYLYGSVNSCPTSPKVLIGDQSEKKQGLARWWNQTALMVDGVEETDDGEEPGDGNKAAILVEEGRWVLTETESVAKALLKKLDNKEDDMIKEGKQELRMEMRRDPHMLEELFSDGYTVSGTQNARYGSGAFYISRDIGEDGEVVPKRRKVDTTQPHDPVDDIDWMVHDDTMHYRMIDDMTEKIDQARRHGLKKKYRKAFAIIHGVTIAARTINRWMMADSGPTELCSRLAHSWTSVLYCMRVTNILMRLPRDVVDTAIKHAKAFESLASDCSNGDGWDGVMRSLEAVKKGLEMKAEKTGDADDIKELLKDEVVYFSLDELPEEVFDADGVDAVEWDVEANPRSYIVHAGLFF